MLVNFANVVGCKQIVETLQATSLLTVIHDSFQGGIKTIILIRQIVQQALTNGYLSVEAENQLRQLLQTTKYGLEDINAFMKLQQAVIAGMVRQKSRELSAET